MAIMEHQKEENPNVNVVNKDEETNLVEGNPNGLPPCPAGQKRNKDGVCEPDGGNDTHP